MQTKTRLFPRDPAYFVRDEYFVQFLEDLPEDTLAAIDVSYATLQSWLLGEDLPLQRERRELMEKYGAPY